MLYYFIKPRIIACITFFFACLPVFGQQQAIVSKHLYGGPDSDVAYSIEPTADGGYILMSIARPSIAPPDPRGPGKGMFDIWVTKLNSSFGIVWHRFYGGAQDEYPSTSFGIHQTKDGTGDYVFAAMTSSSGNTGDISGHHGANDIWVVRITGTGNIVWKRCLGGVGFEDVSCFDHTADGGFILSCTTSSSNSGDVGAGKGGTDIWIVKLTAAGTIDWQRTFGGSGEDYVGYIRQTPDGGYIFAGSTGSPDGSGDVQGKINSGQDAWIVKINSTGVIEWQRCLGGSGDDNFQKLLPDANGGYWMAGTSTSALTAEYHGGMEIWVAKLDVSHNIIWQRLLGGIGEEYFAAMELTADGGLLVSGSTNSTDGDAVGNHSSAYDYFVAKLRPTGETLWTGTLGSSSDEFLFGMLPLPGYKFLLAGESWALDASGATDGDVAGSTGGHNGDNDCWIVIASDNFILPVQLLHFTVSRHANYSGLSWSAGPNAGIEKFIVQRSVEGTNFSSIGEVAASQTSSTADYGFRDHGSIGNAETVYYRLLIVYGSGARGFSKIVRINLATADAGRLLTNMVTGGQLTYEYQSQSGTVLHFEVISTSGAQLLQRQVTVNKGINKVSIPLQNLPRGTYFLTVSNKNAERQVHQFVVRH